MQKKHASEKESALKEMANFKNKSLEREKNISNEFQSKFDSLKDEVGKMNNNFQEKINKFESINSELKKALEKAKTNGEAKDKYDKEMAELVHYHDDKFQKMMLEQLEIQEKLKKESIININKMKIDTESRLKDEHEKNIGTLRAQLKGDKEEALMTLRRELEEKMQIQKSELMNKIEKLLLELNKQTETNEKITIKHNLLLSENNDSKTKISELIGDNELHKSNIKSLESKIKEIQEENIKYFSNISELNIEIKNLKSLLSQKESYSESLESTLRITEQEVSRLLGDLARNSENGASSEANLRSQLNKIEKEAAGLRTEVNQMASTVAGLREDLKKSKENTITITKEFEKTIATLEKDKVLLSKQLQDALNSGSSANDKSTQEILNLRKQLQELEENMKKKLLDADIEMKKQVLEADESGKKNITSLRDKHAIEIEALNTSKVSLLENAALKYSQLETDLNNQRNEHDNKVIEINKKHAKEYEDLEEKHRVATNVLKDQIIVLEAQLLSLSEQSDGEKGGLKKELEILNKKAKDLQKELENKKKEIERTESVTNGLKNQVESLREELKATQKAFRDKMDAGMGKLESDWQAKLDAQIKIGKDEIATALKECELNHKSHLDELIKIHDDEIKTLKNALQKEASGSAEEMLKAENERIRLEKALSDEKENRAKDLSELNTKYMKELNDAEIKSNNAIDNLRKELNNASENREKLLIEAQDKEVSLLRQSIEKITADQEIQIKELIEKCNRQSEDSLAAALAALEIKLKAEEVKALAAQQAVNDKKAAEIKSINDINIAKLTLNLENTNKTLDQANSNISQLTTQLSVERIERQNREEKFVIDRDTMSRAHDSELRKEKESSERAILDQMRRASQDINLLKEAQQEDILKYEERLKELQNEYLLLETRLRNRESRPEDIARIRDLEREMIAKDELVQQTKEEMMYFKREMLNREENFNNKFGSSPNVGIMNPLKIKDNNGQKGGMNVKSSKPQNVVAQNGGGAAGMMGGLGGMGINSAAKIGIPGAKR